jgi:hypothetical protein
MAQLSMCILFSVKYGRTVGYSSNLIFRDKGESHKGEMKCIIDFNGNVRSKIIHAELRYHTCSHQYAICIIEFQKN